MNVERGYEDQNSFSGHRRCIVNSLSLGVFNFAREIASVSDLPCHCQSTRSLIGEDERQFQQHR
jgi:hypothetical protein